MLLIVSNTVDMLVYLVWETTSFPKMVIKRACHLDSAQLYDLMEERLGFKEHGDVLRACIEWSGCYWCPLKSLCLDLGTETDRKEWKEFLVCCRWLEMSMIKLKGYPPWTIGLWGSRFNRKHNEESSARWILFIKEHILHSKCSLMFFASWDEMESYMLWR